MESLKMVVEGLFEKRAFEVCQSRKISTILILLLRGGGGAEV